jgi:hypothetical protein
MISQKALCLSVMLALGSLEIQSAQVWAFSLPYDNTCPVIYDNDDADDMYTDEYLLSLAGAGNITLKGMITSSGGWSQPLFPDPVFNFQWDLSGRNEIVGKGLRSGMSNLPTPVAGSGAALVQPGSGIIEDTTPVDTPGAHLIVTEAHNATPNQPLVVVMGGPPTTLASAYLLDHSITNTVVLTWLSGGPGENDVQNFNDTADQWATTIVDQRFRVVLFGPVFHQAALVDKSQLTNLPNTELRQWMIDKSLPHVNLPGGQDHDGPPAISLMRPDYVLTAKPKSVGGVNGDGTLFLQDDPNGNILMVTAADQTIATTEWWRALSNSAAYGNNPLPPTLTPYTGSPLAIPGRVEAEQFDYGGPGVSYSNLTIKTEDEYTNRYITTFRVTDDVDFDRVTNTSGYAIAVTQAGEWLDYTVNVAVGGLYALDIRLASQGAGGTFHIEFGGIDQTGPLTVPNTGGWQNWQTLTKSNVTLTAGQQVMRLVLDSGGISNLVGDIDYLGFNFVGGVSSNPPAMSTNIWEVTTSGADATTLHVSFNEDFTLGGYGIRADCAGVFNLSGTWQPAGARGILGSMNEDSGCGELPLSLSATVNAGRSLKATATAGAVVRKWRGVPLSSLPDLGGRWLGEAQDKKLHVTTVEGYDFVARDASPGVFDIVDITTDSVVGCAIVTSRNQVRAHVIVNGRDSLLTGKFNSKRRMLVLKGVNVAGHRTTIQVTQQ